MPWRTRSRRASAASRRWRRRSCAEACTTSRITIPTRRAPVRPTRSPRWCCGIRAHARGAAVRAPPLAGLGLATVAIATGASAPGARPSGEGVHVKGRSLVNHWIEVALEPTGALALHDRRSGQRFAELLRIEDGGDAGDTYSY